MLQQGKSGRPGVLPCLVPQWPQIMQIRISLRSRFDLVLDADHTLDFFILSRLQACISFYSVLDQKWRLNVFLLFD